MAVHIHSVLHLGRLIVARYLFQVYNTCVHFLESAIHQSIAAIYLNKVELSKQTNYKMQIVFFQLLIIII